ncbi:class I SAM-dependent methyltransferase [Conexibacter sp. DBS9H8]|uniref:class I SAM-dependent methyltransferase n=1 Tax=Conexibacter sp. DBS9H8 TaxID=2937801 RepID=UPI00200ED96A|nr:class I SAM-dependent methyltransferase [Conexibacter sp. DBS9H8]
MSDTHPPREPTTITHATLAGNPTPADGAAGLIAAQREHWQSTLTARPGMYGAEPSQPGRYATERFSAEQLTRVLELGAGQGRDTLAFLRAGLHVHATDYAPGGLAQITAEAGPELSPLLATTVHDVRQPLPFPDRSFDACYAHMLFTMALSSDELAALASEVHRVLEPGGLCIYTARHTGDADYGTGRDLGDNLYENGGFVVHFFTQALVDRLAEGFALEDITAFEEGNLPRRLWQVTMRRT